LAKFLADLLRVTLQHCRSIGRLVREHLSIIGRKDARRYADALVQCVEVIDLVYEGLDERQYSRIVARGIERLLKDILNSEDLASVLWRLLNDAFSRGQGLEDVHKDVGDYRINLAGNLAFEAER
jgi:hypothetical protein